MRILYVSASLEVGGAERLLVGLARDRSEQGHRVEVAAAPGPLEDELAPFGIPCHPIPAHGRSLVGAAATAVALGRVIRSCRPTVIHADNPKMTALTLAARRLCPGVDAPVLAVFHGGDVEDDRTAAMLLRRADRLVCVEDDLGSRMLAHGCRPDRTELILNCAAPPLAPDDPLLVDLDAELGHDGPVVAIIGTLSPRKAVDRFVRAAGIVVGAVPHAQFLVVGDGPMREDLERLVATSGLGRSVRFLGVRRDVAAIVQRATVVVSTSRGEGLSLVALESLGAGTPLIAPDIGGMRRLLDSGAGILLEDAEPTTVAAAITRVLCSPEERCRMSQRARALIAAEYDQRVMLDRYAAIYDELAASRP
jgi:glycosyltransferase involved in cell wall biosynthesis